MGKVVEVVGSGEGHGKLERTWDVGKDMEEREDVGGEKNMVGGKDVGEEGRWMWEGHGRVKNMAGGKDMRGGSEMGEGGVGEVGEGKDKGRRAWEGVGTEQVHLKHAVYQHIHDMCTPKDSCLSNKGPMDFVPMSPSKHHFLNYSRVNGFIDQDSC